MSGYASRMRAQHVSDHTVPWVEPTAAEFASTIYQQTWESRTATRVAPITFLVLALDAEHAAEVGGRYLERRLGSGVLGDYLLTANVALDMDTNVAADLMVCEPESDRTERRERFLSLQQWLKPKEDDTHGS